jgi:putative transposase
MMESQSKRRRSLRLPNYDYTLAGCYSLTICSLDRECLFGEIRENEVLLSNVGHVVQSCWDELPLHFPRIILDAMVLMPNHLHAIVFLRPQQADGSPHSQSALRLGVASGSLSAIVRSFKSASTRAANQVGGRPSRSLWQRNY